MTTEVILTGTGYPRPHPDRAGPGALVRAGDHFLQFDAGRGTVGLYHLAWEVDTLGELERLAGVLRERGSLVGASDHGTTKSLYAKDPDGLEFEIVWLIPAVASRTGANSTDWRSQVGVVNPTTETRSASGAHTAK